MADTVRAEPEGVMQEYEFCTLFDCNYLFKGVSLYESLMKVCRSFRLHVLCMDELTEKVLSALQLPNLRVIPLRIFEDGELTKVRASRSKEEYCWTCTPSLILFVFERNPEVRLVTYLDADVFLFGDPAPIFEEFEGSSILITEHRFPDHLKYLETMGRYNVQFVSFRRDSRGLACLRAWREACIEWCYKRVEDGKFGDQKYLDDWPVRFQGVHVLRHLGGGLAPWNFSQYRVRRVRRRLHVGAHPLIFYHFHQFHLLTGGRFSLMSAFYAGERRPPKEIYQAYVASLRRSIALVKSVEPDFSHGVSPEPPKPPAPILPALVRRCTPRPIRKIGKQILASFREAETLS